MVSFFLLIFTYSLSISDTHIDTVYFGLFRHPVGFPSLSHSCQTLSSHQALSNVHVFLCLFVLNDTPSLIELLAWAWVRGYFQEFGQLLRAGTIEGTVSPSSPGSVSSLLVSREGRGLLDSSVHLYMCRAMRSKLLQAWCILPDEHLVIQRVCQHIYLAK